MRGPLLGMVGEAPPRYVAFVARHLEPLRRDAVRATGDEYEADRLYPDVLTDVAVRWTWLELLGTRLGRPGAADRYLRVAFDRRCRRGRSADGTQPAPNGDIVVLRPGAPLPPLRAGGPSATGPVPGTAPDRTSAAARRARVVRPAPAPAGPPAEAAIAWWHAYESHRRRIVVTALVVFALLSLVLLRAAPSGPPPLP